MSNKKPPVELIDRILNKSDSYYSILGVLETATQEEISKAYKSIVMKLHPDRCKLENTNQAFLKVSEAYETLSDIHKKRIYDQRRQNTGIFTSEEMRDIFSGSGNISMGNDYWRRFNNQNVYNRRFVFSQTDFFRSPSDIIRMFQRDFIRQNQNVNSRERNRIEEFIRIYAFIICIIIFLKILSYF